MLKTNRNTVDERRHLFFGTDAIVPDTLRGSIQSSVQFPTFLLSLLLKKVYGYISKNSDKYNLKSN